MSSCWLQRGAEGEERGREGEREGGREGGKGRRERREGKRKGMEGEIQLNILHLIQDSIKLTLRVECVWSSYLDIVVWRGHGEVEHARRHVHAVCGHCCVPVCPNVAKMVVSAIVVIVEWT